MEDLPIENQRLPSKINKRRYRLILRRKLTEKKTETRENKTVDEIT